MSFWTIYWPMFAALSSIFAVTELFHVGVGYYFHWKQERLRAEFEAKVASGEIDPMQALLGGKGGPPGMEGFSPSLPTASGSNGNNLGHGQYL